MLGTLVVWLPIVAVFAVILWLRAAGLDWIRRQRTMDRCVFEVVRSRCEFLSNLSQDNHRLRQLQTAIAAARKVEIASAPIPGVDVAVIGVMETWGRVAMRGMRFGANALIKEQNAAILIQKTKDARILGCGIPTTGWTLDLGLERVATLDSVLSGLEPPLSWSEGVATSELVTWDSSFRTRSFGHCRPAPGSTSFSLDGESYVTSARPPPPRRATESAFMKRAGVKLASKLLSALLSF
ncbi:MAG: hypothetical protein HY075_05310 [Deltaproteobacteria bacterium]|nr:hypothetical protein [Deltaproteobacteria bacterium]